MSDGPMAEDEVPKLEKVESRVVEKSPSDDGSHGDNTLQQVETESDYPPMKAVAVIMACIYSATFLFALDRTIIGTAIPQITDDYHSFDDVGWYGSSYLLTFAAFQLIFGRLYTFYSPKWTYIACVVVFEIGSAVSGAAPSSIAFIIGRAISGLGASGMLSGSVILIIDVVPLHKRPMLLGFFGAVFGVASVAGPLLGGVFTSDVTWRWCFYINLPIGGVAIAALALVLKSSKPIKSGTPWREQVNQLDPIGTMVFLPAIVCLLLALQWGGVTYAWGSGRIIALFVLAGVLFIAFFAIQFWRGEKGTLPPRIFKQRSVAAATFFIFCLGSVMMLAVYYIPIFFQALQDTSAVQSGIRNLPLLLSLVIGSIGSGIFTQKVGYYVPAMIACSIIMPVGSGLISTWAIGTDHPKWIGYQVILGFGIGIGMQQPAIAAQTVLDKKDVATGTSLMFFSQTVGGAIFLSAAQTVLTNKIAEELVGQKGFKASTIAQVGATELRNVIPARILGQVLHAYQDGLRNVFYVMTALSAVTVFAAAAMEFKNVKTAKKKQKSQQDQEKQEEASAVLEA